MSAESQARIDRARDLYGAFSARWAGVVDVEDGASIVAAWRAAETAGIFDEAARVREHFFGRDLHFYGVTYLWDMCMEACVYCPAAVQNRKKARYKPLELSVPDAVRDVRYVMGDGHRHLCVLTGEDPVRHPPEVLAEFIAAFDELGLKEIILNVEPPEDDASFGLWRAAARKTALQFRVFQETYDRQRYEAIHPTTKHGRKHDYEFRHHSQSRALAAGFDNVGLGVLFGNSRFPIREIDALVAHDAELRRVHGKGPARICLPSAKHLTGIDVSIAYDLAHGGGGARGDAYTRTSELSYALARLALPTVSIVSSERDSPEVLQLLNRYATCSTLNVHPGVGDNIRFHEGITNETLHFEQAPSFSRDPERTRRALQEAGWVPLLAEITNRSIFDMARRPSTVNLRIVEA
ncbi:MAG: hypothetical protein ACXVCV_00215 [Polyangia bacterium]